MAWRREEDSGAVTLTQSHPLQTLKDMEIPPWIPSASSKTGPRNEDSRGWKG